MSAPSFPYEGNKIIMANIKLFHAWGPHWYLYAQTSYTEVLVLLKTYKTALFELSNDFFTTDSYISKLP